jgi:hypothetical protein
MEVNEADAKADSAPEVAPKGPESASFRQPRRRGRPRADEVREKPKPLPRPPGLSNVNPAKFFRYWLETDAKYPNRVDAYLYRRWPTMDREAMGLTKHFYRGRIGDDQLTADDLAPEFVESTFLHRWGEGDYKIYLTDNALSKTICNCVLRLRDADHPAIIEPLESLKVSDPANREYIEGLRRRGVTIPGEQPGEGEDMAKIEGPSAAVASELVGTVERLMDRTLEMASEKREREDARPAQPEAMASALRVVQSAAEMGNQIIEKAVLNAQAAKPTEMLRDILDFARGVVTPPVQAPAPQTAVVDTRTDRVLELLMGMTNAAQQRADAAQAAQYALMQKLLDQWADRQAAANPVLGSNIPVAAVPGAAVAGAGVPTTPQSPVDSLRDLLKLKQEFQDVFSAGEEGGAARRGGGWTDHLPTIMQGLVLVSNAVSNSMYNLAVLRSGEKATAAPLAPPQVQAAMEPEAAPGTLGEGAPGTGATGGDLTLHSLLVAIREPLLRSINNGDTGYVFADVFREMFGETVYGQLREMGPDKILRALSGYPPIWNVAQTIPNQFQQFMDEFLTGEEEEEGGAVDAAGAATNGGALAPSPVPEAVRVTARPKAKKTHSPAGIMDRDPLT